MSARLRIFVVLTLLATAACGRNETPRGVILISLDTLRADHLGAYGYRRPTSPFFDSLAERGVLFEHAYAQFPSTLTSHMSMLTGLYPQQHAVYPPSAALDASIGTLAEYFQRSGFATAGFTEGGFVAGRFGFDRGFDVFEDPRYSSDEDVVRTLNRGLDFLDGLEPDRRFFVFLHTYAMHDPYAPPESYRALFHDGPVPANPDSNGQRLKRFNNGELPITGAEVAYFETQYDATLRWVDDVLQKFFDRLIALGLSDRTLVVITSDHGEEFLEHGRLGHTQLYPESLRVPLLFVGPGWAGPRRVDTVVESVDLAPTLVEAMGLPPWPQPAGTSLAGIVDGESAHRGVATADLDASRRVRTLIDGTGEGVVQMVSREWRREPAGTWIGGHLRFDLDDTARNLEAKAYAVAREMSVLADGIPVRKARIGTTWQALEFGPEIDPGARVIIAVDGCDSPKALGKSNDARCLGVCLRGAPLRKREIYDLTADPLAQADVQNTHRGLSAEMQADLDALEWTALAEAGTAAPSADGRELLEALGYLDEATPAN